MDKLAELIGGLKDYFNDFVGAIVPGAVLAAGVLWLGVSYVPTDALFRGWGEWNWLPGVSIIFLLGHALLALHELATQTFKKIWKSKNSSTAVEKAKERPEYKAFVELMAPKLQSLRVSTQLDFNGTRSIAMSIATNGADLGRRFMFISLFCYGTSAACWVIAALDILLLIPRSGPDVVLKVILALVLGCTALLLRRRGSAFELRALSVPFAVAMAQLLWPAPDPKK